MPALQSGHSMVPQHEQEMIKIVWNRNENMKNPDLIKVTTLVDNEIYKRGLKSSWGLSFFIEIAIGDKRHALLMDTSDSFEALSENARKLGVNLSSIDAIFISHWHIDHCGSLHHVLPLSRRLIPVYVPSENPSVMRTIKEMQGIPVVCPRPIELFEGVLSTGEIWSGISEQSLIIKLKRKGLVILTGCSHPGVMNITKRAQEVSGTNKIHAVIGGLHISSMQEGMKVAESLRRLGVKLVSPCHCTGVKAKIGIVKILEKEFVRNGVGKVISIGETELEAGEKIDIRA